MATGSYWNSPKRHRVRGWVLQFHLWCGIAIGAWALAIGFSGSILVFKDEIEGALHPEVFRVAPPDWKDSRERALLDAVAAAIQARFPQHFLGGFRNLHEQKRSAYVWIYRLDENGDLIHRHNVHFNQHSGRVLGAVERYTGFPGWFEKLHFFLLMGRPGLAVNGFMAIALLAMCATGLVLWWPGGGRLRHGFRIQWRAGWRRLNYDLHRVGGLATMALLSLMAVTGMYFAFNGQVRALLGWIGNGQEAMSAFFTPPRVDLPAGAQLLPLDSIYTRAASRANGLLVANVTLPRKPGDAFTVDLLQPGDSVLSGMVRSFLHPTTGETLRTMDSHQQPAGVGIALAIAPIHFGQWGGFSSKVLWALLGLAPGSLFLSGLLMWWNRVLRRRLMRHRETPAAIGKQRAA